MTGLPGNGALDDEPERPALVDARGDRCPVPVIKLGEALRDLGEGRLVRLLSSDPAAQRDVPAFCRMRRQELVGVETHGEVTAYLVRKVTPTPGAAAPGAQP